MSLGGRVADVVDLRTIGDNIDYPFLSGLSRFVHSVVAVHKGILPLISKEVLEITYLAKFGYL